MREAAERWLTFAEEDLRAAEILFREEVWNQVCFHAQQCVEKALKGFCVLQRQQPPPRTHAIVELLELLPREWLSDIRLALAESIDTYYIPTRYPDALPGTLLECENSKFDIRNPKLDDSAFRNRHSEVRISDEPSDILQSGKSNFSSNVPSYGRIVARGSPR